MGDVTTTDLLARLEAMAAQLGIATARLDEQAEEIALLKSTVPGSVAVKTESASARTTTRRRLLMGALAAGAAVTALTAAQATPVQAVDPNDIVRDGVTVTSIGAHLISASGSALLPYVFKGNNFTSTAFIDPSARVGLLGSVSGTDTTSLPRYGVYGHVDGGAPNAGVYGLALNAAGVVGGSDTSFGVIGLSTSGNGVRGTATDGIGVYGQSSNNYGMQGVTTKSGFAGLVGVGPVAGSAGFYALGLNGATAGTFQGDVVVNGNFTATGIKSAAVKRKDGSLARLYCVESPESWFEDFGTAQLRNGVATVVLSPDFDEVVDGTDYRVFLTEIGDCGGLYVSRKGPHLFDVRSRAGAPASGSFDYRVVAKRRDIVGNRLEKVVVPTMTPIDIDEITRRTYPAPPAVRAEPQDKPKPGR